MMKGKMSSPRVQKKIKKLIHEGYSPVQAAAIAYSMSRRHKLGPRGGKRRNPIDDRDLHECLAALAWLYLFKNHTQEIPPHILDVLESEELWDREDGVTKKGVEFLHSVNIDDVGGDEH